MIECPSELRINIIIIYKNILCFSPKPTIKWTHNGKEVGQGHQYKLTAAVNRSGHYQCTAHNLKGQETKAYILKIESKQN